MLLTTLSISYLVVSLVSAVIFYCACAVGTRDEHEQEAELDQSDLDFQFNHLEWAEKGNI